MTDGCFNSSSAPTVTSVAKPKPCVLAGAHGTRLALESSNPDPCRRLPGDDGGQVVLALSQITAPARAATDGQAVVLVLVRGDETREVSLDRSLWPSPQ
jgi:hypothetical protein